jgi:hypothetical protein
MFVEAPILDRDDRVAVRTTRSSAAWSEVIREPSDA